MPKRTTTAAITLVSNDVGRVVLGLNAAAAPGATINDWSVDWGDDETEDHTEKLPAQASHAYVLSGPRLIVFTVKDSKNKIVSTGLNVVAMPAPIPIPPEEGTFDALMPPSDSGVLFDAKSWQYQSMAAPLVTTATVTPSASGTKILAPTGQLVAGDNALWTWGAPKGSGIYAVLRNGLDTQGGGSVMKTCNGSIYHLASNGWWRYVESGGYYESAGTSEPCANVTL